MKPYESSKKLNPLGDIMNLSEALNQLKKHEHNNSFNELGEWLDHNSKKPKKMKTIYKVAASFTIMALLFVACSIPVEQEEEIGYMIKGKTESISKSLESEMEKEYSFSSVGINPGQLNVTKVIQEEPGKEPKVYNEYIMVLPEANLQAAIDKKAALESIIDFSSLEILPIEDKVRRSFFETAIHKMDLQIVEEEVEDVIVEERVVSKINAFIHENSEANANARLDRDEKGNRIAIIEVVEEVAPNHKSIQANPSVHIENEEIIEEQEKE